jgi:phosphoesterase RecJ-like protein
MDLKTARQIVDALKQSDRILITSHVDPDGDSVGSQLALYDYVTSLGKIAAIFGQGTIPSKYLFLNGIDKIVTDSSNAVFDADTAVVLEATSIERIGKVKRMLTQGMRIVNIDHHIGNSNYGDLNLVDESASSVGELLYKILKLDGFRMHRETAEKLYTAILTDTGRFHFASTTPDALRIAAELVEAGARTRVITDKIYFSMSAEQTRVIGEMMCNAELVHQGRVCVMSLTEEMVEARGMSFADFEGAVEYSMYVKSVEVGMLFKSVGDNCTKVSIRSRSSFDVAALARRFGGGGHVNAAGATIMMPFEAAKKALVESAGEVFSAND